MKDVKAQEELDRALVMLRDAGQAVVDVLYRHRGAVTMSPMLAYLLGSLQAAFAQEEND